MNPWWGIVLVSGSLLFLLVGVKRVVRGSAEFARKTVHVGMGLICLSFPWLFREDWPVWVLAGIATLGLGLVRFLPELKRGLGSALHGTGRSSMGELLFAPAVALVFSLSDGRQVMFVIPVLVLTLADAAGALAGTRWGLSKYGIGASWKSIEGSAAFLLCAVVCVALPLVWLTDQSGEMVIWIALTVGLLATMAEGLADHGSDNLLLPVWVFFLLERFFGLSEPEMILRCGEAVALLVLVVLAGKRSTLDGAALLAAGLLGYGLLVLGGPWFLVPVLGLFASHLLTTFRWELIKELRHGREPVFGVAVATLSWTVAKPWVGESVALLGCTLGASSMLVIMHAGTREYLMRRGWSPLGLVLKVGVLVLGPGLWAVGSWDACLLAGGAMMLAGGGVYFERRMEERLPRDGRGHWLMRGVLALLASMVALFLK